MENNPTFFQTPSDFEGWLEKNHDKEKELWVGYYKKGTLKPSITWPESVKEALCFGWIDGIRKSVDKDSYMIRFTPRRPNSIWSEVNVGYIEELKKKGKMRTPGLVAFQRRDEKKSGIYSFEQKKSAKLAPELLAKLKSERTAWENYQKMPPSYHRAVFHWIMTAKKETTRLRRLEVLISSSLENRKIPPFRRAGE